jgi:predicted CopG family antitoxin
MTKQVSLSEAAFELLNGLKGLELYNRRSFSYIIVDLIERSGVTEVEDDDR